MLRWMSNRSASGYVRSSRPAEPVTRRTLESAGIIWPWSSTSAVVQRPCTGEGDS